MLIYVCSALEENSTLLRQEEINIAEVTNMFMYLLVSSVNIPHAYTYININDYSGWHFSVFQLIESAEHL